MQADGKVVINGNVRVNADGTPDSSFDPDTGSSVASVAIQADGRMFLGGEFGSVGGFIRNRVARINADGTLDGGFDPGVSYLGFYDPLCVAQQADGKVLLGGQFNKVAGIARIGFARLLNDPATQSLTVSSATRVEWLRGGTSPEVGRVTFELSTDGGNTYSPLGAGSRIAGGWELTGLSLPATGQVRARGRTTGGRGNGSSGLVQTLATFGASAPEIAVEQPTGTDLADGGSASFGSVGVGEAANLTFTIRNSGNASLTGLAITKDGADQAMFTVTSDPVAPVAGGGSSTSFTVRFVPDSTGPKTAALHIASNDADENPFDITLTGTGTLSTNADLAALSLSVGTLNPAFASATTGYTATVGHNSTAITVTPVTQSTTGTVRVNAAPVSSGNASAPINLSVGQNTLSIVVTAGDGVSAKTYTVTVTRAVAGPGDLDLTFSADSDFIVTSVAVQPDEKMIIGGFFDSLGGVPRSRIARLNADGSVDSTFNPNANDVVHGVAVQADGKVLVVGEFTSIAGSPRKGLARLNANGTLDAAFNPTFNGGALCVALQADGKIILGGGFGSTGVGVFTVGAIRLQPNGSVDGTFRPTTNGGVVRSIAVQADGKVLLGGSFNFIDETSRNNLARINVNGTVDAGFNPFPNGVVHSIAVQPDGKVLLGGEFTQVEGFLRNKVARLNGNGTLDNSFAPNPNESVQTIVMQADGKVLIGGDFNTVAGASRIGVARLHADGTLDNGFNPDANSSVHSIALQGDGGVILGGFFNIVGGNARGALARIFNGPATQSLTATGGNRVEWLRGGTSQEVEQVTFELSTDAGMNWSPLGAGTRIAGGWARTGLSLPASGQIRARGRRTDGSGSTGLVERVTAFGALTPLQQWKLTHLADADAPDLDDPDGDGLRTLAEYGLNLLPEFPNGAPFVVSPFTYAEGDRLRVFIERDPAHNDVIVEVQAADALSGPWSALATSTLGAPFAGAGYVAGDTATPGVKTVEIRDTVNISDAPDGSRFLRVEVRH